MGDIPWWRSVRDDYGYWTLKYSSKIVARPAVNIGVKYGFDCGVLKKEFESDVFAEDIIDGCLGEASGKAIGKVIDKARPNNYSSFRNKAK